MFWIDLEMTGLDVATDRIIEVAVIITDARLKVLDEYCEAIQTEPKHLAEMSDWCKKTHGESGLVKRIETHGLELKKVERDLIEIVQKHFKKDQKIVLCGNSVGNDQRFLIRQMPNFASHLHYRIIDVSSFKEIFRVLYQIKYHKQSRHRALDDIKDSIQELRYYLKAFDPQKLKTN